MKNGFYVLILLSSAFGIPLSHSNHECFTPNDLNGVCINIRNCPLLRSLLENHRKNDSVVSFLRNSRCGYEAKDPKVCCPLDKETFNTSHSENNLQATFSHKVVTIASSGYETVSSTRLPSQTTCGMNNQTPTKILQPMTELGTWPWITAIGYKKLFENTTDHQWLCVGTLISDKYILTAAHCTEIPNRIMAVVRLGDYDLDPTVNDEAAPIDVPIEYVIPHEHYNVTDYTNDIALLKLEHSVSFNKLIQPICLPIFSGIRTHTLLKTAPYIAGWGIKAIGEFNFTRLLEVQTPVLNNEGCKRAFADNHTVIDDRVLCLNTRQDNCQGDSGGPLMFPGGKMQYYLVGIESYRLECGIGGTPGIYTRVTYFIDWIVRTMENN